MWGLFTRSLCCARSDGSAGFSGLEPGGYLAIVRHHYDRSAPLIVPVTVTSD